MRTFMATILGISFLGLPAQAQARDATGLNTDIVSPQPEASEDCEALRESLRARRDDNALNAADMRELRDKGC